MKQEETQLIAKRGEFEGKSQQEINTEISNLINSQRLFKIQTKEIERKDKLINQLDAQIEKLKQKNFLIGLNQQKKEVKEDKDDGLANTKELRRIILCLKGKELDINSIRTNAEVENKQATDGINFLVRYNLVEELNNNKYTSDKKRK